MTYDQIIEKKYKTVAFLYEDRIVIIKITSVKSDDLNGKEFAFMLGGKIPMFKSINN